MIANAGERPLTLWIVDDQALIRRGMALILAEEPSIEVVGQASDGQEAVSLALSMRPDVVVMDLRMPNKSGVVATQEITDQLPDTRVVVLTTYDDDELVFDAICAGAQAYLLKDAGEKELIDTIRAVRRGESRLSPKIAAKVMQQFRRFGDRHGFSPSAEAFESASARESLAAPPEKGETEIHDSLTDKESKILELIALGKSNKQIAAEVFLAEGTVKNYVSRIMDKLHAESRYQLAARARARPR